MKRGWLIVVALWLHQVAIAFLSPLSGEDWATKIDFPDWPTFGDLFHALIVDNRIAHVALTPLVVVSLPIALATLMRDRRLRLGDADDAVLVLVLASLAWLTIPHFGLACSFRRVAAIHLAGLAAASWFVVGFRAIARSERPPGAGTLVALAIAGVIAGATTRPIGTATIVVCALIAARVPRGSRRFALIGIAALIAGAAMAWVPDLVPSFGLFLDRGVDGNLRYFNTHMRVPAWVVAGTLAIWVARTAYLLQRGRTSEPLADDQIDLVLRAVGVAFVMAMVALVTTDLTLFQLIGPGAAVTIAVAVSLIHLARGRRPRIALVIGALAVQVAVVIASLHMLVPAHREFEERLAVLEAAPPGTIAIIAPYHHHDSNPWFFGEDFRVSSLRDRVATLLFGLRGIELAPALNGQQPVPPLVLRHDVDDGDPAAFPAFYSADLATAREQFADAVARAKPRDARLVASTIAIPGRPRGVVVAAWLDRGEVLWWHIGQAGLDRQGNLRLMAGAVGVVAMWSVDLATGQATSLPRDDDGVYALHPGRRMTAGIVECTDDRCALADVIGLY